MIEGAIQVGMLSQHTFIWRRPHAALPRFKGEIGDDDAEAAAGVEQQGEGNEDALVESLWGGVEWVLDCGESSEVHSEV